MCGLEVGQRVVCIRDYGPGDGWPELKRVYTIRELLIYESLQLPALRLVELVHPIDETAGVEPMWWAGNFRPVKRTDISVFRKLLRPVLETA